MWTIFLVIIILFNVYAIILIDNRNLKKAKIHTTRKPSKDEFGYYREDCYKHIL